MRRVWVAVYENNVFFLASALTFDALVAALPFTLLALGALGYVVQDDRDTLSSVHALLDRFLPMRAGAGGPMDPGFTPGFAPGSTTCSTPRSPAPGW
ncbi:MAG: hypothetical protein HYY94_05425 [Gemmatimonadetes bacterium]|nr:hypothetical protein [Gemmatimonadota bacterium]